MPLSISTIEQSLLIAGAEFQGTLYPLFCKALSSSLVAWSLAQPQNVALTGVATGSAGAGTVKGLVQFFPTTEVVYPFVQSAGFLGVQTLPLVTAIVNGITLGLSGTSYSGVSAGVGTGADISRVTVSNPLTLAAILQIQLHAFLGTGALVAPFAQGLAQGIALYFLQGVGTGVVLPTGVVTPIPAVTATVSSLA